MSLSTTQSLFRDAQSNGYAIVGFAAYNLETIKALVLTAERLRAPVMIQTTPGTIDSAGLEYLTAIVKVAAGNSSVPVALHLDHGESIERAKNCLNAGYTSIMIDASHLSFEENVRVTREVVAMAHAQGVGVEAEIGRIGGVEDDLTVDEREAGFTDPRLAVEFVNKTGIDSLAISIGTAHGLYKGEPNIRFELLSTIRGLVTIPLVLHGASGVPDASIHEAVRRGIVKMNIATELKIPFADGLRNYLISHPVESDPRKYFSTAIEAYSLVVETKLQIAGAIGRV